MPLLIDELSVWDISFRWAGYDPRKFYIRLPLEVENYARTLIDAIHNALLSCESITLEKRQFDKDEKKFSFYYWADDFFATTSGQHVSRELLKWAQINRYDFMQWCERMNAPLPEFWFPRDWNLNYELPENELAPGHWYELQYWAEDERKAYLDSLCKSQTSKEIQSDIKTRPNQEARIACQHIACAIWRLEPDRTIASIVKDPLIQEYGGAKFYVDDTVRVWVQQVAPKEVSAKRGRPRKNGD